MPTANVILKRNKKFSYSHKKNIPVSVYPDEYIEQLKLEIKSLKNNIKSGKQPVFNSVDELIYELEKS